MYPLFLKLKNTKCVVIGGGSIAERKISSLLKAEADVTVISPELTKRLKILRDRGKICFQKRIYRHGDLDPFFLVIAATNSSEVNKKIFKEAIERGILINSVDDPENSNFFVPSLIRRGDLQIAFSSSGKVPYLTKKLREHFDKKFHRDLGRELKMLHKLRTKIIKETGENQKFKNQKFKEIIEPKINEILKKIN